MWFAYEGEWMNWFELSTDRVHQIIEANKKREPVASLEDYVVETASEINTFKDSVGEDSLTRFDKPKNKRNNNKRRRNKRQKSKRPKNNSQKK
jgi:hypothetical protein